MATSSLKTVLKYSPTPSRCLGDDNECTRLPVSVTLLLDVIWGTRGHPPTSVRGHHKWPTANLDVNIPLRHNNKNINKNNKNINKNNDRCYEGMTYRGTETKSAGANYKMVSEMEAFGVKLDIDEQNDWTGVGHEAPMDNFVYSDIQPLLGSDLDNLAYIKTVPAVVWTDSFSLRLAARRNQSPSRSSVCGTQHWLLPVVALNFLMTPHGFVKTQQNRHEMKLELSIPPTK